MCRRVPRAWRISWRQEAREGWRRLANGAGASRQEKQKPPAPLAWAQLIPTQLLAAENPCGTPGTLQDGEGGDGSGWLQIPIARRARDSIAQLPRQGIVARMGRDTEGGSTELRGHRPPSAAKPRCPGIAGAGAAPAPYDLPRRSSAAAPTPGSDQPDLWRSEEHTSELQSLKPNPHA